MNKKIISLLLGFVLSCFISYPLLLYVYTDPGRSFMPTLNFVIGGLSLLVSIVVFILFLIHKNEINIYLNKKVFYLAFGIPLILCFLFLFLSFLSNFNIVNNNEIRQPEGIPQKEFDQKVVDSGNRIVEKSDQLNYSPLGGDGGKTSGNCHTTSRTILEGASGSDATSQIDNIKVDGLSPGLKDNKSW